ncbi:MAG: hypothetical protein IPM51_10225 [Sphingobacteriaceae bacterium]|nr:hypothetical protein [Sphingobacteriaceae bacterium]
MTDQEIKKDQTAQPQKLEDWFKNLIEKIRPYVKHLWEIRKKLFIVNGVVAVILLVYLYLIANPYFESTVTILPEYGSKSTTLSGLSQLASLAGVRVGEGAPTEIYQNIILSETVLGSVIYAKYRTEEFNQPVNLIQYFLKGDTIKYSERKNFLKIYEMLVKYKLRTNLERFTRILTLTVTMPESKLSAEVANKIAESLDLYVRTKRKTYASEQSFYLEKRTAQVKDSLSLAEEKLKSFREQNRVILQSPALLLQQGRLMRDLEILNAVYIELNKQLEIAKIDDIRETPIVNIKEWAEDPVIKTGPKRVNNFITIMFFSVLLSGLFYVFQPQLKHYYAMVKGARLNESETSS